MEVRHLHDWGVSIAEAKELQTHLAADVVTEYEVVDPRFIAGTDISAPNLEGIATGAIVVVRYPELVPVEIKLVRLRVTFPYVPGLLSFREAPLLLAAWTRIKCMPDLVLMDGQGIAHPRRLGLASHVGLFLDLPTIGCAKSRLIGKHDPVKSVPGNFSELYDKDQVIGVALCTKANTKPIYISIGHKVNLNNAIHWVMKSCGKYRIPEPTRLAHLAASGRLEELDLS
ncbi:MAG: deoxyribonuclease V [Chloroflexota bacterium]|nr:deoxyribonuclease V [Chloroflexota bacterium]